MTRKAWIIALSMVSSLTMCAAAQQTTITPAATQPGDGIVVHRTVVRAVSWDVDPERDGFTDADEVRADVSFAYGLSGDWSLLATIPVVHRDFDGAALAGRSSDPTGLGDPTVELRHRFVNEPLGPVDTLRVAWFAGVELPLGRSELSSHSFDPYVGIAVTSINDRLGLGAGLSYKATTSATDRPLHPGDTTADLIRLTGSSAWRVHPAQWGTELEAATYVTCELEVMLETSGDAMVRLAPGILLEAPTYALEAVLLIPVAEDATRRPDHELAIAAGFRLFF